MPGAGTRFHRPRRQVPGTQTALKTVELPRSQSIDKAVQLPLILRIYRVTKHVEIPPFQYINKVVEVPVVLQPQVSQTALKTVEAPRSQFIDSCAADDHSDQPGDQACRNPADSALRARVDGGRGARVDAGTGLPHGVDDGESPVVAVHRQICVGDQPGDQACRDSTDPVHQQACGRAYCDTATGTSGLDCAGDGGSPDGAVRRQSGEWAGDHADHAIGAQGDRGARQARRVPDQLDRVLLCTAMTFIDEQIGNSLVPMTQALLVEVVASIPELLALRVEENEVEVPDPPIQERIAAVVADILKHVAPRTGEIAGAVCRSSRLADSGTWRRWWRGLPRIRRGATLSGRGRRFGLAGQQQPR